MASANLHENKSQFFFTLGPAPELDKKHTIFGKVVGKTLYNMLKLNDVETDQNERPLHTQKILKVEIIDNPFEDMICTPVASRDEEAPIIKVRSSQMKATKNFSLLSFGDEAEEDEEEAEKFVSSEKFRCGKSSHDLLSDPKLSSEPVAVSAEDVVEDKREERVVEDFEAEEVDSKQSKAEKYKKEYEELKNSMRRDSKRRHDEQESQRRSGKDSKASSSDTADFVHELKKYKAACQHKKGAKREDATLELLAKFENRLHSVNHKSKDEEDATLNWMSHRLECEEKPPERAKDASVDDPERYHLFDPRNPINKRKREMHQLNASKR